MKRNNDYTISNLFDYESLFKAYGIFINQNYKLIAIDLRKQTEFEIPALKQQIDFIGRFDRDNGAIIFFIIKKSEETLFGILQNAVTVALFSLVVNIIENGNSKDYKSIK